LPFSFHSFYAQNRVVCRIKHQNRSNGLACRPVEKQKYVANIRAGWVYISHIWEANTPERIEPKFVWW